MYSPQTTFWVRDYGLAAWLFYLEFKHAGFAVDPKSGRAVMVFDRTQEVLDAADRYRIEPGEPGAPLVNPKHYSTMCREVVTLFHTNAGKT